MRRDVAPDPVRRAEEVAAVPLSEQLDAARCGNAEIDRLAAFPGKAFERVGRELDELRLACLATCVAHEHRSRPKLPAAGDALDQPLALEGAEEPRGRALGQPGAPG